MGRHDNDHGSCALPVDNKIFLQQGGGVNSRASGRDIRRKRINVGDFPFDDWLMYQHNMWLK
jgi:hypothetical protein